MSVEPSTGLLALASRGQTQPERKGSVKPGLWTVLDYGLDWTGLDWTDQNSCIQTANATKSLSPALPQVASEASVP